MGFDCKVCKNRELNCFETERFVCWDCFHKRDEWRVDWENLSNATKLHISSFCILNKYLYSHKDFTFFISEKDKITKTLNKIWR